MHLIEPLKHDTIKHTLDTNATLTDHDEPHDVEIEHCLGRNMSRDYPGTCLKSIQVKDTKIGEAPVLLRRVGERQLLVAHERLSVHATHTSCETSACCRRGPGRTRSGRHPCRRSRRRTTHPSPRTPTVQQQ